MKIRINKVTDHGAWYAKHVGKVLTVERVEINRRPDQGIPEDVYWCREGGTYNPINYVRKSDATEVAEQTDLGLQIELAEAKAAIYVPGCWRCAKCGFELTKSLIGVSTGNIAPDMAQQVEPCPNDGEPMERTTWKRDAMRLADRITERMQRERGLSELFERRAKECRRQAANMARLVSPGGKPDWAEQYWIGRAEAWEIAAINLQQSNQPI